MSGVPGAGLRTVGPQWFAPVMGLAGLSLAWHRAGAVFGPSAQIPALLLAALAAVVFMAVIIASGLRAWRHPSAVLEDFAHPVRHGFVAALPISLLLLVSCGVALGMPATLLAPLWIVGALLQGLLTIWVLQRLVFQGLKWPAVTPILFIPIVGNLVVPLAGPALGFNTIAWAFFGIGLFFWPLMTVLVFARTAVQALPERLVPTWFITVAPPSVAGMAIMQLGASPAYAWAALGIAIVFLGVSLGALRRLRVLEFGLTFWAMSFPIAALAALALRLSAQAGALGVGLAMVLIVLASLLIFFLLLATWRGLRSGNLLAPESIAVVRAVDPASEGAKL